MKNRSLINAIQAEFLKIIYSKSTQLALITTCVFQPLLAYFSSRQILTVGLDGTPDSNPELLEAIPPIEYMGFDAVLLGILAMIILASVLGSLEYKNNSLRTSLLLYPNKITFFHIKILTHLCFFLLISTLSIYLSIAASQLALGSSGLNPIFLNERTWQLIMFAVISWTLLAELSYILAFYAKSAIPVLLFLIPQLYNLGSFLAERFLIARLLPVSLATNLIVSSPIQLAHTPVITVFFLTCWVLVMGLLTYHQFVNSDLKEMK
ncbi:ABC transporter permease [Aerococcus sanguinicola]